MYAYNEYTDVLSEHLFEVLWNDGGDIWVGDEKSSFFSATLRLATSENSVQI